MVSAGTAAGFPAIRDSSETRRLQESQVMCPREPAEDAHGLDGIMRKLGFILQIHIFSTLEILAFLSSLITCLGQSTCNFLDNILLWYLHRSFNDFNCNQMQPASLLALNNRTNI